MEINRVDLRVLITGPLLAQALSCIPPGDAQLGHVKHERVLVLTLVFVIAGGHIFGPVHSKPPLMKLIRVLCTCSAKSAWRRRCIRYVLLFVI